MVSNSTIPIKYPFCTKPDLDKEVALKNLIYYFGSIKSYKVYSNDLWILHINSIPNLVYRITMTTTQPEGSWIGFVSAKNGKVLKLKNILMGINGYGWIYPVDPISRAHGTYGGNLVDNNDMTNAQLNSLRKFVTLNNIKFENGKYKLENNYAKIYDTEFDSRELFLRDLPIFSFTRETGAYPVRPGDIYPETRGFEAVMGFYYIDLSYRYINEELLITCPPPTLGSPNTGLLFDPYWYNEFGGTSSFYDPTTKELHFPAYEEVDQCEDAGIIFHETAHSVHDRLTDNKISWEEGLNEAFADYWSLSMSNSFRQYKDYEQGYYNVFRWVNHNEFSIAPPIPPNYTRDRKANITLKYADINLLPNTYYKGQIFSTVLMKIYNDIGRQKTDVAVLNGMSMTITTTTQPQAATLIYIAASNNTTPSVSFTNEDLCIMHRHFKETYGGFFTQLAPGGIKDLYMKDNDTDLGVEENPFTGAYWNSDDIWVKNDNTINHLHNNPKFGVQNIVYVTVRSRGCVKIEDNANLSVYWAKASTGLSWPEGWDGSNPVNGFPVSGMVGTYNLAPLNLLSGQEIDIPIVWTTIPDPNNFPGLENQHYCLLARIESTEDPIHNPTASNPNFIAKQENNVIWRNITIYPKMNLQPDTGTIFIKDFASSALPGNNCLQVLDSDISHYGSVLDCAELFINLREPLKSLWISGGMQGTGYVLLEDGRIKVDSLPMYLCNMQLLPGTNYIADFIVEKNSDLNPFAFDVSHTRSNNIIGGERFVFPGSSNDPLPRNANNKRQNIYSNSKASIKTNPFRDLLGVYFDENIENLRIEILSMKGLLLAEFKNLETNNKYLELNLSSINYTGVVFIKISNTEKLYCLKGLKI